ncbi:MGH1-like glycoside hydrolase domain-containing protein [Paenibacillus agricola]|uniref:Mannosylglycerate hydrolase MGH1-like glycoside hydrolase domain-containing protein n=1 Tax=Paenibacillus agricola TaxID=2716264 RepID=A0ABX0J7F4_9BACL|nr:hypothetical protein [Paenibacillus agricola]NHN32362.1 hypothetical protein [Paenibacillus agricola]
MSERIVERLRRSNTEEKVGELKKASDREVLAEWKRSGVRFAASSERFEGVYDAALRKLLDCIVPTGISHSDSDSFSEERPILHEGGIYLGCWLESTGTINAELLSRFIPSVSEASYECFADFQLEDGQMPYKITEHGAAYRQIQMVTPLARSVWNHYLLNGRNKSFLRKMYQAIARFDEWLVTYRNTRGSGCVEAFCTFDTGHDLSPRFWHIPDTPHLDDARQYNPDSPVLPLLAPDLTANVYCQRLYLQRMAEELGESGTDWNAKATDSLNSLFKYCFDEADAFFYDLDRNDKLVRVQSDVLLRVLACEVGDREFFDNALRRYLLNTRKFFAKYPFTSMAMDDPRFDPMSSYNSWGGPTNFLSLIRTPHAFEYHGRFVELTWVILPILSAFMGVERFAQALSPWTGKEGFTQTYSPAILCLVDFVERLCGILPTAGGELWFTGLVPYAMDHGEEVANETAYSRTVEGHDFELANTRESCTIYRNGAIYLRFPNGLRVVTDREGSLKSVIGMSVRLVEGTIQYEGVDYPLAVKGNEILQFADGRFTSVSDPGVVPLAYR